MTVRVLIVDDSAVVRQTLSNELAADPEIEVVGTASDPYIARDKIVQLKPDVITLDMPRMDGISFLRKLMKYYPLPVVIVSSLAERGSQAAVTAIEAGAVEVMCKPGGPYSIAEVAIELRAKVKAAARVQMSQVLAQMHTTEPRKLTTVTRTEEWIIAIGASTGGTRALEHMLREFPANAPGTVIVQHMPAGFTRSFAERLNEYCAVEVREASSGDTVQTGRVLIAPGNFHMLLKRRGEKYIVDLDDGPLVNRHRPSVDVLFHSAASCAGKTVIGVMLTGMGTDGAKGMLAMKAAGAFNIAQDEASSIVFGMPKAAIECGAVDQIVSLADMSHTIFEQLQ